MSTNTPISAIPEQTLTPPLKAPSPATSPKELEKSLLKQLIDLAIACQNATDTQLAKHLEELKDARQTLATLSSLEAEFSRTDNNEKARDNNTPLTTKEQKLIKELKQMGVELPASPTIYDIRSAKDSRNLKVKHTYQKADDLVRNKSSFYDIAKEIMKMVNRSIFGMIDRMNQR